MTTCHHLCTVVVVEEQVDTSAWCQVYKMVDKLLVSLPPSTARPATWSVSVEDCVEGRPCDKDRPVERLRAVFLVAVEIESDD